MNLAIMQAYFFPYIGYFQLIKSVDKFIVYENVSFRKKSWIARNTILANDGKLLPIVVPVSHKSSFKEIRDLQIVPCKEWNRSLINKIYFAYKKARFFEETFPVINHALSSEIIKLHEFNAELIKEICSHLEITTIISSDNSVYLPMERELDGRFSQFYPQVIEDHDNMADKKTERIISICKQEKADCYYNSIGGFHLYSREDFMKHNLDLRFLLPGEVKYGQFHGGFTPNLSIIDVMMHCGKVTTRNYLDQYQIS
jgi:hypothetical protein